MEVREINMRREAPGVIPLAYKGHVMQQRVMGRDWIYKTKMQIRTKVVIQFFSFQNILSKFDNLATSHHTLCR